MAADPGVPTPFFNRFDRVSDQARGFMLIYNIYTSSTANPGAQNTRFNITNTSDDDPISVHLYFVEGSTCSISDRYICLTPNQTMTFLASEQDPLVTGYLIAVATSFGGFPAPFDFLIGDEYVKFDAGFFGNLGAEAIPSSSAIIQAVSPDGSLAALAIAGLPRVLAVDSIGSRGDGNETLLVINGLGGVLSTQAFGIGALFGILYNDQEEPHSWTRLAGCQLLLPLNDAFPRTTPRFDVVIPSGQTGWMKFWSTSPIDNRPFGTAADGRALLGAVFQRNPNTGSSAGAFQEARNLHKLNLVSDVPEFEINPVAGGTNGFRTSSGFSQQLPVQQVTVFIFPVFPSNCGFVDIAR
jgi:hypothetical protein